MVALVIVLFILQGAKSKEVTLYTTPEEVDRGFQTTPKTRMTGKVSQDGLTP
jgi:hypothetical protein